jgi:ABC-type branched-subunit amino acid transport system ATPase component
MIADHLIEMIVKIRNQYNTSMVVVEQFSPQFLNYLDICYVMEMGQVIFCGSPRVLKEDEALQKQLLGIGL